MKPVMTGTTAGTEVDRFWANLSKALETANRHRWKAVMHASIMPDDHVILRVARDRWPSVSEDTRIVLATGEEMVFPDPDDITWVPVHPGVAPVNELWGMRMGEVRVELHRVTGILGVKAMGYSEKIDTLVVRPERGWVDESEEEWTVTEITGWSEF